MVYFRNVPALRVAILLAILLAAGSSVALAVTPLSEAEQVHVFFAYLLQPETDIGKDTAAQQRWLSKDLRDLMASAAHAVSEARKVPGVDGPDPAPPDNGIFLNSWDFPSECVVEDSAAKGVVTQVEVVCHWGKETNYPGVTRKGTVFISREMAIQDILWRANEYASESRVSEQLKTLKKDAERLSREYSPSP